MEIQLSDKVIEIKQKGKISEIFKNEIEKSKYEVIAAKFNNEYVNLDYEIKESGKLELIDISTKEGMKVYRRTLTYLSLIHISEPTRP